VATKRQVRANRLNGRKGGPRTPEGKARSRLNARRHGVFSALLDDEDRLALSEVHEGFAEALLPVGAIEERLVAELALVHLRTVRCASGEAEFIERSVEKALCSPENALCSHGSVPCTAEKRARTAKTNARSALSEAAFARLVETFGRYDRALTNRFLRLLDEVERLQEARRRAERALWRNEPNRAQSVAGQGVGTKDAAPRPGGLAALAPRPAVGYEWTASRTRIPRNRS
jgi:hypothetical protein